MKWFKHISTSLDDPFIFDLIDKFGGDGYLVFFGILEIMAREFDINSPGICTLSDRFLTKKLQLSRQKLIKILKFCDKNKRIFFQENGKKIILNCPKLKDMCDEWTKKELRSKSRVTPESLRPKELEEEIELEREIIKKEKEKEKKEKEKNVEQPKGRSTPSSSSSLPKNFIPYKAIIDYLNKKTGKSFSFKIKETRRLINARWNQGFRLDDFKRVIDIKTSKWLTDPKMVDYLRPQTLFGTKFESYLNERGHPLRGVVSETTMHNIAVLEDWEPPEERGKSP